MRPYIEVSLRDISQRNAYCTVCMLPYMAHDIYILECADKTLYVGYTTDLEARQQQHCEGRGGRYTAARLAVRLVYSELCDSQTAALRRERQVKGWTRAKKAALVARDRQLLKRLSPTPRWRAG
jgi:predicted GIY-YIG superfamily endonuclease